VAAILLASVAAAAADEDPDDIPDLGLDVTAASTDFGGASPLATSRTVLHWSEETANSVDQVTYGYNMVGVNPSTDESATIGVDIIPLEVNVAGHSFSGSQIVPAVVASPLFQTTYLDANNVRRNFSYASTPNASTGIGGRGTGGQLGLDSSGVQLLDATMRAQFGKVGSGYHLRLDQPVVHDPVAIDVPSSKGTTLTSPAMVTYADIEATWFRTRIQNQLGRLDYLEPTRLALFITYDVMLFSGGNLMNVVTGAHGAGPATGHGNGPVSGNGNQPIQTFVWGSWLSSGFFTRTRMWAMQDIHSLSHEIVEWAVNPFGNNTVAPWFVDRASQYGCSDEFETGDPVVGLGFSLGYHHFDEVPRFSEHVYHPSDEVMLPWFMRSTPETQGGRYTFMGSLNRVVNAGGVSVFQHPATGCSA